MGLRQSTHRPHKKRRDEVYQETVPRVYATVPQQPGNPIIQQQLPAAPQQTVITQPSYMPIPMMPQPQPQPQRPIILDRHHDDEYVDVVGSDAGNMTVFSWITQLSTCCASLCTLVVLIAFVVWMFLNRNINTLP